MNKQKLYLETSVWNFYFADDAPEKKEATASFFEKIKEEKYEIYISEIVLEEIEKAEEKTKSKLINLINEYNPVILLLNEESKKLANDYINQDVLAEKSLDDARHAAIATINKIEILISWNLKHLANFRKMNKINEVNKRSGYTNLILTTP
jgi:predicted nucleic acid-binding protein